MTHTRQMLLGAFFLIVLAVLGAYTLFLTDFSLFKSSHLLVVHFPEANGLRKGDSVLVAGIRQGRVQKLAYDPAAPMERRITVTLRMDQEVGLRQGFDVFIEDSTVLGGKHVYIDPGPAEGAVASSAEPLQGRVKPGPLEGLGELVDRNAARFDEAVANIQEIAANIKGGKGVIGRLVADEQLATDLSDGVKAARASFENIQSFTADARAGKGPLGRLITDEDLAQKMDEVITNLQVITTDFKGVTADIQAGRGVIGRLAKDEKLADDVQAAVDTIKNITARFDNGDGPFWMLVEDEELAKQIKEFGQNLDQGTLGKLFSNDEIYLKMSSIADDIAASTAALRNAEGTIGKLVMDSSIYDRIERALGILTRALEEYREAAPITTFTTVLFSGF